MRRTLLLLPLLFSPLVQAMQALDDDSLAGVSGQDGISMETTGNGWSASSVSYSDDGQTLALKDVSNRPQAAGSKSTTTLDVVGNQLRIEHSAAPEVLNIYSDICGWTLARAHARSGDRVAIASYLGSGAVFDRALADFAAAYADQNERDHGDLVSAIAAGRLAAESGI